MPKRFTDTDKWKDEWFLSLSNDYRIIWLYILDNCTNAGRMKKNFKLLNFCCNTSIDEKSFMEVFKERVLSVDVYFFIPKFLKFQYPKGLGSNKPAIISIRKEVEEYNLNLIISQSLGNDYLMIKDMDKDKDKDKEKEKPCLKDVQDIEPENKEILPAWNNYIEMRKKLRKPATAEAKRLILKKLRKYSLSTAIDMLNQSIERSWTGVFEVKPSAS